MGELNPKEIYQITWLIRRAYRLMGLRADQYLKDLDVSICDRSIMDHLYPDQKHSVPQIAELYNVSRQHVQSVVNSLSERGIIELLDNPNHKRSPLIGLTNSGHKLYAEIRKRDEQAFSTIFSTISESENAITHQTLTTLIDNLSTEIELNN